MDVDQLWETDVEPVENLRLKRVETKARMGAK